LEVLECALVIEEATNFLAPFSVSLQEPTGRAAVNPTRL